MLRKLLIEFVIILMILLIIIRICLKENNYSIFDKVVKGIRINKINNNFFLRISIYFNNHYPDLNDF